MSIAPTRDAEVMRAAGIKASMSNTRAVLLEAALHLQANSQHIDSRRRAIELAEEVRRIADMDGLGYR